MVGGALAPPPPPNRNFVVTAPIIMEFSTGIKLDAFYKMVTKKFVMSLLLRNYDVKSLYFSQCIGLNFICS